MLIRSLMQFRLVFRRLMINRGVEPEAFMQAVDGHIVPLYQAALTYLQEHPRPLAQDLVPPAP